VTPSTFDLKGLTHREAADELGVSVSAVKARLHYAREHLSRSLSDLRPKEETTVLSSGDFVEVQILDVRPSRPDKTLTAGLVVLGLPEGDRILPVFSGLQEVAALAFGMENVEMPRPMTYQFALDLLAARGEQVTDLRIDKLAEGTYFATVITRSQIGEEAETDARPSDAPNVAVLAGSRISAKPNPSPKARLNQLHERRRSLVEERLSRPSRVHVERSTPTAPAAFDVRQADIMCVPRCRSNWRGWRVRLPFGRRDSIGLTGAHAG
jgi:bifunctional DNase/RNase